MAQASVELIDALRHMARCIENGNQTGLKVAENGTSHQLMALGLTRKDLQQLESLSNPDVLEQIERSSLKPEKNRQNFAVLYLHAWANLLENQLLALLDLPVDIRHLELAA